MKSKHVKSGEKFITASGPVIAWNEVEEVVRGYLRSRLRRRIFLWAKRIPIGEWDLMQARRVERFSIECHAVDDLARSLGGQHIVSVEEQRDMREPARDGGTSCRKTC